MRWETIGCHMIKLTDEQLKEYRRLKIAISFNLREGILLKAAKEYEAAIMLLQVRDQRLYRHQYATFDQFVREVCEITKTYANDLIRWAELRDDLFAQGLEEALPHSERVGRELLRYPQRDRKRIWIRAKDMADMPTQKMIQQAAGELKIKGA